MLCVSVDKTFKYFSIKTPKILIGKAETICFSSILLTKAITFSSAELIDIICLVQKPLGSEFSGSGIKSYRDYTTKTQFKQYLPAFHKVHKKRQRRIIRILHCRTNDTNTTNKPVKLIVRDLFQSITIKCCPNQHY